MLTHLYIYLFHHLNESANEHFLILQCTNQNYDIIGPEPKFSTCMLYTKHKLYQRGDVPIHEFIRVNKMIPYKSLCYKIKTQNRTTRSVLEY